MSDLTKEEFGTYKWTPSLKENERTARRKMARAEAALLRKDLEDYPGEAQEVHDRLMAEAAELLARA